MKRNLLLLFSIFASATLLAQAPGGVADGLQIWLKADNAASVTKDNDNNNVTAWHNLGALDFSFTNGAVSPVLVLDPNNNSISFGGGATMEYEPGDATALSAALSNSKYEYFAVSSGSSSSGVLLYVGPTTAGYVAGSPATIDHLGFGNRAVYFNSGDGADVDGEAGFYGNETNDAQAYHPNTPNNGISGGMFISNIKSHPVTGYNNVNSLVFSVNGIGKIGDPGDSYDGMEKNYNSGDVYSDMDVNATSLTLGARRTATGTLTRSKGGNYYEIILYNRRLSLGERQKVLSYLAMKYNLYLTIDTAAASVPATGETVNNGQYFLSDSTIVFERDNVRNATNTADSFYTLDNSFGFIGRDDASGLDKRGINSNSTYLEHNPTSASFGDMEFMAMTVNQGGSGALSTDLTANPVPAGSNIMGRVSRVWKVTNTGFNGQFNFVPVVSGFFTIAGTNLTDSVVLLVSEDPDFTSGKAYKQPGTRKIDGSFAYFDGLNAEYIFGSLSPGESATRYFTVARLNDTENPLPVGLQSLSAEASEGNVTVKWSTATEQNSDYFEITRSGNGVNFATIGKVNASGNSNGVKNYSFTDGAPLAGTNFYRLKLVDLNGKSTLSEIVSAKNTLKGLSIQSVVWRGAQGLQMRVNTLDASAGTINIFDASGHLVTSEKVHLKKGINNMSVRFHAANGVYVMTLVTPQSTLSTQFVK